MSRKARLPTLEMAPPSMIMAQATGFPPPAGLPFVPADGDSAADTTIAATGDRNGNSRRFPDAIVRQQHCLRQAWKPAVAAGGFDDGIAPMPRRHPPSPRSNSRLPPRSRSPTPTDSGFRVVIGGTEVLARYFETGLEGGTPSITKLVVPASAVDAAPNGASIMVRNCRRYLDLRRPEQGWHPLAGALPTDGRRPAPRSRRIWNLKSAGFTV